ncbi:MAG TPA: class I SAM-dependent methyltransferase [Thermoanaerobaculia bacterium]
MRRLSSIFRRDLLEVAYTAIWKLGARLRAPAGTHGAIFTRIYRHNEWGDGESRSGPGSTRARGADFRASLREIIERFGIRSILDAPCGDYNWMRDATDLPLDAYIGVDVVAELIAANKEQYADDAHSFLCRDITRDALPAANLILCRDALVHFSYADIHAAIANFKRSGSKYLLATTFAASPRNEDIRTGGWRALNLQVTPFEFPVPLAVIRDVPPQAQGVVESKQLALWELSTL